MRLLKIVICIMFIWLLIYIPVNAKFNEMNLDEAIQYGLEHHPSILNEKYQLEEINLDYSMVLYGDLEQVAQSKLLQLENKVSEQKMKLKLAEIDLISNIQQAFFSWIKMIQLEKQSQQALGQSKQQLEQAKIQYESGLISEADFTSVQNTYSLAENTRKVQHIQTQIAQQQVYQAINYPAEETVQFNYEMLNDELPSLPELEESIQYALQHRFELQSILNEVKEADNLLKLYKIADTSKKLYIQAEHDYHVNLLNVEEMKNQIIIEVYQKYLELVNLLTAIERGQQEIDLIKKQLTGDQLKYSNGLISFYNLVERKQELYRAEYEYTEAIYAYHIKMIQWDRIIGKY